MKTKSKIWLGIGAFALVQAAGVSMEAGRPSVTLASPAQAADGTCGWERSSKTGRWIYDDNCERGERYVGRRPGNTSQGWHRAWDPRSGEWYKSGPSERGERWEKGERGERWNERGERGRNERGRGQWEHGEKGERWGERG